MKRKPLCQRWCRVHFSVQERNDARFLADAMLVFIGGCAVFIVLYVLGFLQ
jgi:hypothetical protein